MLFSGSLFLRTLFGWARIAPATPAGGLAFIAGWFVPAAWGVGLCFAGRR